MCQLVNIVFVQAEVQQVPPKGIAQLGFLEHVELVLAFESGDLLRHLLEYLVGLHLKRLVTIALCTGCNSGKVFCQILPKNLGLSCIKPIQ